MTTYPHAAECGAAMQKSFWRAVFDVESNGRTVPCQAPLRNRESDARADLFTAAEQGTIHNGRIQRVVIDDARNLMPGEDSCD